MEGEKESSKMKRGYPVWVWLTANVLTATGVTINSNPDLPDGIGLLLISALFSAPALFLNTFLCRRLAKSTLDITTAKARIIVAGFGFVIATFLVLILFKNSSFYWQKDADTLLGAIMAYGFSAALGAAIFKLRETKTETEAAM